MNWRNPIVFPHLSYFYRTWPPTDAILDLHWKPFDLVWGWRRRRSVCCCSTSQQAAWRDDGQLRSHICATVIFDINRSLYFQEWGNRWAPPAAGTATTAEITGMTTRTSRLCIARGARGPLPTSLLDALGEDFEGWKTFSPDEVVKKLNLTSPTWRSNRLLRR